MAARFPEWIRRGWASGEGFRETKHILADLNLHTVCQSARCPNIAECWHRRTATMMILGNVCTRQCLFCGVQGGGPFTVDPDEPRRVAEAIARLELKHAVVTSVTRDDLDDGGAGHFAETVAAIRTRCPETTIEVLLPDFQGRRESVAAVLESGPDVFGHNIETVERLHGELRDPRYTYRRSLAVLEIAASLDSGAIIKSSFMVGHGETPDEVRATLSDLLRAGCEAVSIGQYLRPDASARPVAEYVDPEQFRGYEDLARSLGFAFAVAAPFVRSSYHSEEVLRVRGAGISGVGQGEQCHAI